MMGLGMSFGLVSLLLMALLWVALIALAIWLARGLFLYASRTSAPSAGRELSARETLDRRYVQGEVTSEEYELMKESIS